MMTKQERVIELVDGLKALVEELFKEKPPASVDREKDDIKLLIKTWYERNPVYEYDESGHNRFWGTLLMVIKDYNSLSAPVQEDNQDERELLIGKLKEDIHDLYGQLHEKDKEIERLNGLIEQLMNGEKLKVIRNDVGNYTIISNPNNL